MALQNPSFTPENPTTKSRIESRPNPHDRLNLSRVEFHNRYTRQIEQESIYGEGFLRWTYGNPLGRLSLHALVKRAIFSRVYGWLMDQPSSQKRVRPFIDRFQLKESEFLDPVINFKSFNEFFFRKLKPSARPIHADETVVTFPADGRHLAFQDFSCCPGIFAKGQVFTLAELIQSENLAQTYARGALVISRLCPVDYHRFHFPTAGKASAPQLIQGPLQSVNPIALAQNIRILSTNRRCLTELSTPNLGKVLMIEVGATCVGGFVYTFKPNSTVSKGDEKGYFRFGGSLTMTLFEPGRVQLDADLLENTHRGLETYAIMGDRLGQAAPR